VRIRKAGAVAVLGAALLLAGCNSDDKDSGPGVTQLKGNWMTYDGRIQIAIVGHRALFAYDGQQCLGTISDKDPMVLHFPCDGAKGTKHSSGTIDDDSYSERLKIAWDGGSKDTFVKSKNQVLPGMLGSSPTHPGRGRNTPGGRGRAPVKRRGTHH
jgi:hypothetical protein